MGARLGVGEPCLGQEGAAQAAGRAVGALGQQRSHGGGGQACGQERVPPGPGGGPGWAGGGVGGRGGGGGGAGGRGGARGGGGMHAIKRGSPRGPVEAGSAED